MERTALEMIIHNGMKEASVIGQAESGEEALRLCEELQPDMIFMDIKIPGINGIDASKIIKEKYPHTMIFILTAYDEFDFARKAVKIGIDDYILKPAKPEEILSIIEKYKSKIKKAEDSMPIEKLIHTIRLRRYSEAKGILEDMLNILECVYDKENEEGVKKANQIADSMVNIAMDIGLKNINGLSDDIERKITVSHEFKKIREELTDILDCIFSEIIDKKLYNASDEILAVVNYIEKNYSNRISLEEIADYINLNPQYLSRLVKKELGIGFSNYVTNLKIEKAKKLLSDTDMPVLNIALELSYNEANYFCKVFKKIVGMTPMEYRLNPLK
ncbi:MAG: response regulator [Thermotaleaceae bacterium]